MLHDDLEKLDRYPFHMPGHKRNSEFGISGSEIDITEIDGFDNLHCAGGSILEIENTLSQLYRSRRSFMLVNGSTVGILAAIFAVTERGDEIIIARNCHKSVYNACYLRELDVTYIEPEFDCENGYYTEIKQNTIDEAIKARPNAKAVVITSPTYEGNASNVSTDIPLIIDAAHGAHFGFGNFPSYPKGDIIISSLHKTLPSLTQTAVLNVYNDNYIDEVKKYLDIFETSSPSYVLMNSVSKCVEFLLNSDDAFAEYERNLAKFYETKLNNLRFKIGDDKGKIVVSAASCNISGAELADILRKEFAIECEMASLNYVILMTSVADKAEAFDMLSDALKAIDGRVSPCAAQAITKPSIPQSFCKISEVKNTVKTPLHEANGKISGEFVYAYPPDIPMIVPGELISSDIINSINEMIKKKINIISDGNLLPHYILTKAD
ncbi:MAG: aminotransferase class I/II-fold pyridoxal phosphate-dependent enzyme [Eubacterium sp.]|nr:aminotransferase class I/II-fold pyridoxal phosphate-dependent enzyme [Eubacterium sp.]